jgi:anti-sigma B factor antagonist
MPVVLGMFADRPGKKHLCPPACASAGAAAPASLAATDTSSDRPGAANRGASGHPRFFALLVVGRTISCRVSAVLKSTGMATYRRIDVSKVGDVTVVKFVDKKILDEAGILELGAELFGLVELENRKSVLLNFSGVEFLSSAALGKLITLDRKVKSHKGRMKLSNIRPEILEVFQITKLNKVFDIRKDEAEAISAF